MDYFRSQWLRELGIRHRHDLNADIKDKVKSIYATRRARYGEQLELAKQQFPEFYKYYLQQLTARSILKADWNYVNSEFQHDALGSKGLKSIERRVNSKLREIEGAEQVVMTDANTVSELLKNVALFVRISKKDRAFIEKKSSIITFPYRRHHYRCLRKRR